MYGVLTTQLGGQCDWSCVRVITGIKVMHDSVLNFENHSY